MDHNRRAILSTIGLTVPLALERWASAAPPAETSSMVLKLQTFEGGVREAFRLSHRAGPSAKRRVAVGHGPAVEAGLQGCVNDRAFAGFPQGCLRIIQTSLEPGPTINGVRLYLATVDLMRSNPDTSGRPLDFASLPPAPILVAAVTEAGDSIR